MDIEGDVQSEQALIQKTRSSKSLAERLRSKQSPALVAGHSNPQNSKDTGAAAADVAQSSLRLTSVTTSCSRICFPPPSHAQSCKIQHVDLKYPLLPDCFCLFCHYQCITWAHLYKYCCLLWISCFLPIYTSVLALFLFPIL